MAQTRRVGKLNQRADQPKRRGFRPNYVPFVAGLAFLLLKLTRMGSCRTASNSLVFLKLHARPRRRLPPGVSDAVAVHALMNRVPRRVSFLSRDQQIFCLNRQGIVPAQIAKSGEIGICSMDNSTEPDSDRSNLCVCC